MQGEGVGVGPIVGVGVGDTVGGGDGVGVGEGSSVGVGVGGGVTVTMDSQNCDSTILPSRHIYPSGTVSYCGSVLLHVANMLVHASYTMFLFASTHRLLQKLQMVSGTT